MATISSLGIGSSGLDVKSIVSQLVELEKAPLTNLKVQYAATQTKISLYGQIKSMVSALSDAAGKLNSLTTYNAVTTTSSKPSAVTATAIGGTLANNFSVKVDSLAKAQSTASGALLPVGGALGAGTLRLQLGQWSVVPVSFSPSAGAPVDIQVSASDTVTDVASKINGANAGVTATVLKDASGERLLLRSKTTGEVNGFELSVVSDADGNAADNAGLSRLVGSGSSIEYAANAQIQINNVAVSSATNTFKDVVSGVTLTVAEQTASAVDVAVTEDKSVVTAAVNDFVAAYNALNQVLNEQTKYDAATKTAGLLQGDSITIGLQNAMRGILQSSTTGSAYKRLSEVGITQALGGNLEVDTVKFNAALANGNEVRNLFKATDSANPNNAGFAVKFKAFTTGLLATGGLIGNKDAALKRALEANTGEQSDVNAKATRLEASLTRRYSALDVQLTNLNSLNDYIAQQVKQWNKSTS